MGTRLLAPTTKSRRPIFDHKPAGIRTWGSEIGLATDTELNTHTVELSRAVGLDLYLEVDIKAGGDALTVKAAVAQAIADWGDYGLTVGDDLILSQLCAPIFSVVGVTDIVEVRVGTAPLPTQTTNFIAQPKQILDLDTGRITVNIL